MENKAFFSRLTFFNVSEQDYGNYTCVASNQLGNTNASMILYGEWGRGNQPGTGNGFTVTPPMGETWEGSPMCFGGDVCLLLILSALGMWAGGCGESRERGEPPNLPPDSGPVSPTIQRGLALCLGSAMNAKLGVGCRFPSSCSDEYPGEPLCEGTPLC